MIIRFTIEEDILASVEFVFDVLIDLPRYQVWKENLVNVDVLSGPKDSINEFSMWRETRMISIDEVKSEVLEVKIWEPKKRLKLKINGWKGSARRGEYYFDYNIADHPRNLDHAKVVVHCEIVLNGIYGILARLRVNFYKRTIARDLHYLKLFSEQNFGTPCH